MSFIKYIRILLKGASRVSALLFVFAGLLAFAYSEPGAGVIPTGTTVYPPLNTSANAQVKLGSLTAIGDLVSLGSIGIGTASPNQQLEITKNFRMPSTTYNSGNQYGVMYKDSDRFIHDFNYGNNGTVTTNGQNTFFGIRSGNFTMGSTALNAYEASRNTAVGHTTLNANTTGYENTAVGASVLSNNTTGFDNTAVGDATLIGNTAGYENTAIGYSVLNHNTTGNENSAVGAYALGANTTGYQNSAVGYTALYSNTTGTNNAAIGAYALNANTIGSENAAVGYHALNHNTTGNENIAMGPYALDANTVGNQNMAAGYAALYTNTTGYGNAAIGHSALSANTTGYYNSAFGDSAGQYIADGSTANQTSNRSLYLGAYTKANADGDIKEIVIGYNVIGLGSYTAVLGDSSITKTALWGNVGINTTNPLAKLNIDDINRALNSTGNIFVDTTDAVAIDKGGQITFGGQWQTGQNSTPFAGIAGRKENGTDGNAQGYLQFLTANSSGGALTEKMRITSAGNVGIGRTPAFQLDLSTDRARKLTTTAWTIGSDARIKTDIRTIEDGLSIIRQIRPVKYRYNSDFLASHPDVKDVDYYNFIAQEYQKVFPNSVTETDGLLYLNNSNMTPYAIAGVKELDTLVQSQQKEIEELRAKNNELEMRVETIENR